MDIVNAIKAMKKEKILLIPVEDIMPNPMQPRRIFNTDELKSLSESIARYGLIQPISVKKIENLPFPMPKPTAKYEIIAGERRWRASKMAGLSEIKCILLDADREDSAMLALIENLQRSDLSYFEEALAIQTLMLMSGKTQSELSNALSISQSTLSNKLRLLRLSERERIMAMENGFSERHCRALIRIENERDRRPIMLAIIKNKLQAPDAEKLVEDFLLNKKTILQKPKKKKHLLKGSIKDMKMLFNTVDKAVILMSSSGYNASWSKTENENGLEIKIFIKQK